MVKTYSEKKKQSIDQKRKTDKVEKTKKHVEDQKSLAKDLKELGIEKDEKTDKKS